MAAEWFRILLVEDNRADIYLFRKALQNAGLDFELTVIEDGDLAMEFVRGEGEYAGRPVPDLAVIDVSLPKKDGVELLESIRASERFVNTALVVVSSSARPPARLTEQHLSWARYIRKPPDLEAFLKVGAQLKDLLLKQGAKNPARIFLIEDNAADVYLLEKTLQTRRIRYQLTRYGDGEEGIRALRKLEKTPGHVPDLILVDLHLPRREGFDVLQRIRSSPALVGVPVGVLTSSDAAGDRHRVEITGRGERYIHKPPALEEFLEQVGQALEDMLDAHDERVSSR